MGLYAIVGSLLPSVDPTPADFSTAITTAFTGFAPALMVVAGVGLAIAVVIWGFPKAISFFKKTAK